MSIGSLKGVPQMVAKLSLITKQMRKGVRRGLLRGGLLIQRKAQLNCPVDTGNLKASAATLIIDGNIPRSRRFKGKDKEELVNSFNRTARAVQNELDKASPFMDDAAVMFGANYALFVHELHSTNKKFLWRAYQQEKENVLNVMRSEIQKSMTI